MKKPYHYIRYALCSAVGVCMMCTAHSQQTTTVAGPQYKSSGLHQKLWGKHYRTEWITPVRVEHLHLDTAMGGLTPYKSDGGNQTKTLRLRTADNKEYVLRSIDKNYGPALPEIYRGTFIENVMNDQVSSMHPYAATTVPPMAGAAGIYHAQPIIRFVPKQPALGAFNEEFGDKLYILEQRPDGDWQNTGNLANAASFISTEELLAKLLSDNETRVDQQLYVRARLFDMIIGDWSRGEPQWRWAAVEKEGKTVYQPVPRDRDQAYSKYDGAMLRVGLSAASLSHIESFRGEIDDITTFNYSARNLDRRMTIECDLETWVNHAKELQTALTDQVIETAVRQMPAEIFPVSGESIIRNLKSRRDGLVTFATRYYNFLAKEVDIPGTAEREHFEVTRLNENDIKINIYRIGDDGSREATPYYTRTFNDDATKELRLYGIAGSDSYDIKGEAKNAIELRIIGGTDRDVITDASGSRNQVHVYDDMNNDITRSRGTKLHLSNDDAIHQYQYNAFTHDKRGLKPTLFFSNFDRFYVGLGYGIRNYGWRKEPFASEHEVYARYSITQNAISVGYNGVINELIGKWDLMLNTEYDAIRWTNFFGIGNETVEREVEDFDYYRVRSRELYAGISLNRRLGPSGYIRFTPFYQATKIINDEGRFLDESIHATRLNGNGKDDYSWDNYGGLALSFLYANVDDAVVTRKGYTLSTTMAHIRSLDETRNVNTIAGGLNFYIPLSKQFVFASRNGAATLTGDPKFYQLNSIGGSINLRGYRRDRFRGTSTFYTVNELHWLLNVKSKLFNGTAGPVVFYDMGRVWEPGEISNKWHSGYGGGFVIAPFNKLMVFVGYGLSEENKVFHLRLNKAF